VGCSMERFNSILLLRKLPRSCPERESSEVKCLDFIVKMNGSDVRARVFYI
jgi:hypothetical protein